jgi:hypothetical protein
MNKFVAFESKKQHTQVHHLFYNSIFTSWKPCFHVPLFWPQSPFGKSTYFGQCMHLPKVAWGNPLLNARYYHNLSILLWIGSAPPS